jgi:benzoyl-CoA reductase/2-hydroxyglutaryl-CoA dehydratase subunit BcrC/BadD/HgdB
MNFLELDIQTIERRIKKINENPDPLRLRSNLLYYELERDARVWQLEAWRSGKPFIRSRTPRVTRAMGLYEADAAFLSNRRTVQIPEEVHKHIADMRSQGFPVRTCEGCVMTVEIILSNEAPKPTILVDWSGCDPVTTSFTAMAHLMNIPIFHMDIGLEVNEDNLQYVTDQINEFIEFAERKVPGIKYNQDKHLELIEIDNKAKPYYTAQYELRKRIPCPIPARDAMRLPRPPSYYPDPVKALEWIKITTEELYHRAEKSVSTMPEEKLRLLWTVTAPLYRNIFADIEKMGVAIPIIHTLYISETYNGFTFKEANFNRNLSLLEQEAIPLMCMAWGGKGKRWVDDILNACKDMKIDGIVNFIQQGCTPTIGLKKLIADRADKELGIPTLQLEGAYMDPEFVDDNELDIKLKEFVTMCITNKTGELNEIS